MNKKMMIFLLTAAVYMLSGSTVLASDSAENPSDGPVVISQDTDDDYPGRIIEVETSDEDNDPSDALYFRTEESLSSDKATCNGSDLSTGIPDLDRYSNVPESENTRWRIPDEDENSFSKSFDAYISSGTIRLEVFYTADADAPEIKFLSSGGNEYSLAEGSKTLGKTIFLVRDGYSVAGFPDIRYSVIYISNAEDPGTWGIDIKLNRRMREFALLTTELPDKWENLDTDYKTQPMELLLWYLAEDKVDCTRASSYTPDDLIKILSKDTSIPSTNEIDTTNEVPLAPSKDPLSGFFMTFTIMVIAGIILIVFITKKLRDQNKGLVTNRILRANRMLRKEEKEAEKTIDLIMSEDMSSYFRESTGENAVKESAGTVMDDHAQNNNDSDTDRFNGEEDYF